MILSASTKATLSNIAEISENLIFPEGEVKVGTHLVAVSKDNAILVDVVIPEVIEKRFAIYDLKELLNVLGLFNNPDVVVGTRNLTVSDETKARVRYTFADESMVTEVPDDEKLETVNALFDENAAVKFVISDDELLNVKKAAAILKVENFVIRSSENGKEVEFLVSDVANVSSNDYCLPVGANTTKKEFNIVFRVENLKLAKGSAYLIEVSDQGITRFTNKDTDIKYIIACEESSSVGS